MKSAEKSYIPDSVDRGNPRPLNEQVYDEICRAIVEKRLVPGDILPKRERLAEAFGVGVNTVRQAVERLVAEKIIVSRPRVGCQIAPDVPLFFCGKILYVLTEFSGAYAAGMFRAALENEFMRSGYRLFAVNVDWKGDRHFAQKVLKAALAERPDFVIVNTCPFGETEALRLIVRSGIPYVTLNGRRKRCGNLIAAFQNDFSAAVADLLSACKRSRVMSIAQFDFGEHSFIDISRPFEQCGINVERVSLALDEVFSRLEAIQDSAVAATRRWSSRRAMPDLIFFCDDYIARGALPVLLEQGVKVPSDVRIVTLANRGFPPAFTHPLDAIEFDPAVAGRTLAQRVFDYLRTGKMDTDPVCVYSFMPRGMLQ